MQAEPEADLASRVTALEDRERIERLFIDYGHFLDNREWGKLSELFAPEGEVILEPLGRAAGPEAIRSLLEQGLTSERGRVFHLIANPIVSLTGNRATSDVSWVMIGRLEDGRPTLAMFGRHRDELIKSGEAWKFLRREGVLEKPAAMPTAFQPASGLL